MTATRSKRQRGVYGTAAQPQPAGHRVRRADFQPSRPRPDDPTVYEAKVGNWVGRDNQSGRFALHYSLGTSLYLDRNHWVEISEKEFERLSQHTLLVGSYRDSVRGVTVEQHRPRFIFRSIEDGEAVGDTSVFEKIRRDEAEIDAFARGERDAEARALT